MLARYYNKNAHKGARNCFGKNSKERSRVGCSLKGRGKGQENESVRER